MPLRRKKRKRGARLYLTSDFHASDVAWKKMLNAVRLGVYEADAVFYAGDLTGKSVVPIVRRDGAWEAELIGQVRRARTEQELRELERDVTSLGFYPYELSREEVETLGDDPKSRDRLFAAEIQRRMRAWLDLAAERLEDTGVPVYLIPGNDDPYELDDVLNASPYCLNVDGKVAEVPGGLDVLGIGKSSATPWQTPREVSEEELRDEILSLVEQVRDPRRTIFLIHCPPHESGLDVAPILDENLRPVVSAGDLLRGPVGSVGVREAIEQVQPLLGFHGHVHESGGAIHIGETLCINPGSEAAFGIVRGYLVDVTDDGVERAFRVEG
jgi:Icc-related predicted phosphoesterase